MTKDQPGRDPAQGCNPHPPDSYLPGPWISGCLVLLWFYLLFFHGLGERDLWNSHEARAGMNAWSVLAEGRWLLPRLHDGRPELQKPPLYYWLVALAARLRGGKVDAWAVRLPSAVSALACVVVVCLLGRFAGRPLEGLLAGVILATAIHFTWLARVGRIDMPLTCVVSTALACFYLAWRRNRGRAWLLAAYVAIAAAVLLKGPIGFVLPAAAFGAFLLVEGELPPPWRVQQWSGLAHRLGLWWGLPLVLALVVPWFWLADRQTSGELTRVFLWHHNIERGLGGSRLRGHPWWFYLPQFLLDFLPWSLLLPAAVWLFFRRGWWRADAEARFGLAWLLGMGVLLSCARYKRADYLVPAYPGAALFLGCVLLRWYREASSFPVPRRGLQAARLTLGLVVAGSAVAWWLRVEYFLPALETRREHHTFAETVRRHVPRPEPLVLFRTEAHTLAFHAGSPVRILLHWDELDHQGVAHYVVMPAASARDWRRFLRRVKLEEVTSNAEPHGEHEKPLVLFRVHPAARR